MKKQKINLNCPIGKTGYGITSLNILKNLYNISDLEVSLFPIGGTNVELNSESEKDILYETFTNADSFDHQSPCLKIWHQFDLASRIGSGHYYAFPFFEVDKLKPKEKVHLNSADGIFVASNWAKDILLQNDITKPVYVAPLGVDMDIFKPPASIKMSGNYKFFHIGKWEHRKGHDFLLQAFNEAFEKDDNVELWLLPFNMFLKPEEENSWIELAKNSKLGEKINIVGRLPTQYHLAEYIYHGDCGIYLSRAEGWNNSILESMALNKPIIATNYSAHTEYCTKDNSYLVDITETEIANDGKWFHGEGSWAKLGQKELDQTIEFMRFVYHNNIKSNTDGFETAKKFSWDKTANTIHKTLIRNNSYANSRKKTKRR
jgi:glycosyltransferase involved in cell wall biosynthesis